MESVSQPPQKASRQSACPNRFKAFMDFLPLRRQQQRNPSWFPTTLPILSAHGPLRLSLLATHIQRMKPHVRFGQPLGMYRVPTSPTDFASWDLVGG